jgi:hypothetical protein
MRSVVILLLACLMPAQLAGQSSDDRTRRPSRRLSFVLELGGSVGGPAAGLAEQLRQAGFDDTTPGGCFFIGCSGPTPHPTQERPDGAVVLSARFAINRGLAVGVGYGNTSLGGSMGYRRDVESAWGDYVLSHWDATILWAAAFWKPAPAFRLGGGPGWYRLENVPEGSKVSQVGLMLEAGAEAPANRRFFLDLAIRAHLVPAKDVEHGWTNPTTLRPDWTHVTLLAGVGVRL